MLNVFMLSVVMLSVVMLSIVMLSVVMLSVVMLSVVMLSVVMLSVVMLNVVAPRVQLLFPSANFIFSHSSIFCNFLPFFSPEQMFSTHEMEIFPWPLL